MKRSNRSVHQPAERRRRARHDFSGHEPGKKGLSQFLFAQNGHMQLKIPKGVLPEFLVKANNAADTGQAQEARDLLDKEATDLLCQMAKDDESHADLIHLMAALVLQKSGRPVEAELWYKKISDWQSHLFVLSELGYACEITGRLSDAAWYRKRAMEIDPENPEIWSSRAMDMMLAGNVEAGVRLLQKALRKDPGNAATHSNVLWCQHYLPNLNRQILFEEHKKWALLHAPASLARTDHYRVPDPDRRLRVGYISPDFRRHSVAYSFEAFLSGRNREDVEVYGYGNVVREDEMTERLKQQFDHYRNVRGVADREVARLIEKDKIDILVELGGHTVNNRLCVLAYKPAPIQIDYGGLNTSGMSQIDYRITDRILDPPDLQKYYVEESVCLPGGFICYTPPEFAPPVAPLPAERNGHVTFGSFNASLKINSHILSLWALVLKATPDSHLLMKFQGGADKGMRDMFVGQLKELGISPDRIEVHRWKRSVEHLQLYGQVDIALDTYPFNGCITTLEGLWMGVPLVSLVGTDNLLARSGLSILSRIGMEFFAASTPADFVAKATSLAQNLPALAKIRASLRPRMRASTICDVRGYASYIEAAYRRMWVRWCRSRNMDGPHNELGPQIGSAESDEDQALVPAPDLCE